MSARKRNYTTSSVEFNNSSSSGELGKGENVFSYQYNRSSTESLFSNSNSVYNNLTDSEHSCESDFEEHDYCLQKKQKVSNRKIFSQNFNHNCNEIGLAVKNTRPKCNSKNAIIARINRQKKKKYIENIELRNTTLEAENKILQESLNTKMEEVRSLRRETLSLRNVIRNSTEIGSLLKCIHLNTNLQISSSLLNDVPTMHQMNPRDLETTAILNDSDKPSLIDEAFVAVILWEMALHTFCQSYCN